MYKELVGDLRYCAKGDCNGCRRYTKDTRFCYDLLCDAADAIEELSRVADAIPHVCECCIGCEVESGGCDRAFVLSPKRAMEYLSKPRWIPATERLPDDGQWVLVWGHGQHIPIMMFRESGAWIDDQFEFHTTVTHWMPLPEPPKENGKSET